jgi:glycosyltransferase involved in cell wall biosynthesis
MKRLVICLVSQEYPEETGWGGIGSYTHEMAHGLAEAGHRVLVVSRALQREQVYEEEGGVTVHRVLPRLSINRVPVLWRLNRFWEGHELAVACKLRALVREHKVDIIEAPALHGETVLFQHWPWGQVPVVVRIHSCLQRVMALNRIENRAGLQISHWCSRRAVSRACGLTAPSRAVVEQNLSHLPIQAGKVRVIPNPINARSFFTPGDAPQEEPMVLFVSRLDQGKGAHVLGQAIPLVWEREARLRFLFAGRDGEAPDGTSMREWILRQLPEAKHGQVEFVDHVPRKALVALYRKASVVVFPSFFESFGYICVEGMACEKVVIATRSGGPEEIIEDGKTGFLVPPGDPHALAEKVVEVLQDARRRREVGQAARQQVLRYYDSAEVSRQMAEYYLSVVERC